MKMSLEDLRRDFILDEDVENLDAESLIQKISKFCKVDKLGFVLINEDIKKKNPIRNRILLVLTARFLARLLQEKLGEEVTIPGNASAEDLAKILKEQKNVIHARAKELKDEKKIIPEADGLYKIAPHFIESTIELLEKV